MNCNSKATPLQSNWKQVITDTGWASPWITILEQLPGLMYPSNFRRNTYASVVDPTTVAWFFILSVQGDSQSP